MLDASQYLLGGIKWQMLEMESVISSKSTRRGIISCLYVKMLRQSFCWKTNLWLQVPQITDFPQNVTSFINYCIDHLLGLTPPTCMPTAEWIRLKSVWNLWQCFDVKRLCSLHWVRVWNVLTCRWKLLTCKLCLRGNGTSTSVQGPRCGLGEPRSWRVLRGACGLCA